MEKIERSPGADKFSGMIVAYKSESESITDGKEYKINDLFFGYISKDRFVWDFGHGEDGHYMDRLLRKKSPTGPLVKLTNAALKQEEVFMRAATLEEIELIRVAVLSKQACIERLTGDQLGPFLDRCIKKL